MKNTIYTLGAPNIPHIKYTPYIFKLELQLVFLCIRPHVP